MTLRCCRCCCTGMFLATVYFSGRRARRSSSRARDRDTVNAELRIVAAVLEVQAFNRADENIEQLRSERPTVTTKRCVRGIQSARAPAWRLSYVALAIVTGVGGWIDERAIYIGTTVTLVCRDLPRICPAFQPPIQR